LNTFQKKLTIKTFDVNDTKLDELITKNFKNFFKWSKGWQKEKK
jgi:hypothetical protein